MMNKMKNNLRILVLILVLVLSPVQSFSVQAATKTTSKVTTVTKKLTAKQKAAAKKKAAKAKKAAAKKKAAEAKAKKKAAEDKAKKEAAEDKAKKEAAETVVEEEDEGLYLYIPTEEEWLVIEASRAEDARKAKEKSAAARAAREAANSIEGAVHANMTAEEFATESAKYEIIDYTESMVPFKSSTIHLNNWFATGQKTGASRLYNCAVTTAYMGILYSNPNYTGTVEELRNKYAYKKPNEGISSGTVANIVNKEGGFATYVWTSDINDVIGLIDKGYIVEVGIIAESGNNHSVIVYGYEDNSETFLIADPASRVDTIEKGVRISKEKLLDSMVRFGFEEVVAFAPY